MQYKYKKHTKVKAQTLQKHIANTKTHAKVIAKTKKKKQKEKKNAGKAICTSSAPGQ